MTMTLYGASLSPYVRKVRVVLAEKGLPYEHVQTDPFRRPAEYFEISPFGRIPALKDGDRVLADSGIICTYLESQYPATALTYDDPYLKARVAWFEKFGDYELGPVATFAVFRNRVVMKLIGQDGDEAQVKRAMTEKLPPLMDYLEANAPAQGFIVGDHFTVADIAIATHFVNLNLGNEQIDAARWPTSAAYIQRILQRPSVAPLAEQEHGFVKKLLNR